MEKAKTREKNLTQYKTPEPPGMYNVRILNDDVTTMDFVVMVLMKVFHKDQQVAMRLTLQAHTQGSAVVGTYYYDIARSKADYAMELARENGYPLKLTVEEAL